MLGLSELKQTRVYQEAVEELYLCRHNPAQQHLVSTTYRLLRELIGLRNLRNYGLNDDFCRHLNNPKAHLPAATPRRASKEARPAHRSLSRRRPKRRSLIQPARGPAPLNRSHTDDVRNEVRFVAPLRVPEGSSYTGRSALRVVETGTLSTRAVLFVC